MTSAFTVNFVTPWWDVLSCAKFAPHITSPTILQEVSEFYRLKFANSLVKNRFDYDVLEQRK